MTFVWILVWVLQADGRQTPPVYLMTFASEARCVQSMSGLQPDVGDRFECRKERVWLPK